MTMKKQNFKLTVSQAATLEKALDDVQGKITIGIEEFLLGDDVNLIETVDGMTEISDRNLKLVVDSLSEMSDNEQDNSEYDELLAAFIKQDRHNVIKEAAVEGIQQPII